jgi:hypothetical protein
MQRVFNTCLVNGGRYIVRDMDPQFLPEHKYSNHVCPECDGTHNCALAQVADDADFRPNEPSPYDRTGGL